mgnify:CR=1 FL=1
MPIKVAINGFGRIGRLVFRQLVTRTDLPSDWQLVQINDPGMDAATAAYLATFDSVHGRLPVPVRAEDDDLVVVMHRGPLHNLPHCYVRIGERVGQGQRCGYIQMGGRVEVYLPRHSRLQVSRGSPVKAEPRTVISGSGLGSPPYPPFPPSPSVPPSSPSLP